MWDGLDEMRIVSGEEPGHAVAEPVDLGAACRGDARENHACDVLRVTLSVSKRERRTPRVAKQEPSPDAEMFAEAFDIGDQMPGGVGSKIAIRVGRIRQAAAAIALIEEDDPVRRRIKIAARRTRAPRARAAMQNDNRQAVRISAAFKIEPVAVAGIQHAVIVWLDLRK